MTIVKLTISPCMVSAQGVVNGTHVEPARCGLVTGTLNSIAWPREVHRLNHKERDLLQISCRWRKSEISMQFMIVALRYQGTVSVGMVLVLRRGS